MVRLSLVVGRLLPLTPQAFSEDIGSSGTLEAGVRYRQFTKAGGTGLEATLYEKLEQLMNISRYPRDHLNATRLEQIFERVLHTPTDQCVDSLVSEEANSIQSLPALKREIHFMDYTVSTNGEDGNTRGVLEAGSNIFSKVWYGYLHFASPPPAR